ncbi:hypothetical protein HanXRQr2_Chr17g0788741 [Helianthus annuus]|nr:uncharacterized protein LOC110922236 [Helianthus annuus]KAF5754216.1 hypothetical protein HanXRQr2_Chr17g0788741 [Helianthus annuus]KAJ0428167.1 hypothetical protein HanHA300_Chr17g0643131 [Helianthus annuus]KAJ0432163.1 hypothetical protein HanIR_Chr17g0856251 [Helianthus annuus]KAJ0635294.1 hypothetical protein HanOQP8_Chr17g0649261 [Helianthus annuus]
MDSGFQFHHDQALSFGPKRHAISFRSGVVDAASEMNDPAGVVYSGMVSSGPTGYGRIGNSCASGGSELVPGLKHDAGLAVEWSVEEQLKLEEGMSIYADEPNIMKYIKIAATLRDKTVRDVALRCRWMMSKRRKHDELKLGRKLKDKKDKLVELSSKPTISSNSSMNVVAPFSVTMNNRIQGGGIPLNALSISTRRLLEQNSQVLSRISANISALKLQDNVNLFNHAKNNLSAILNDMRYIPGPPLPVSLNTDLVNTILPTTSQTMTFGSSSGMHLKQEPEY